MLTKIEDFSRRAALMIAILAAHRCLQARSERFGVVLKKGAAGV